ncbi:MAG: L-threonate dehydrogenase [bacterium]
MKEITVAVVGLGNMGFGAACSLVSAGFTTMGYDIHEETLGKFRGRGGIAVGSPASAAKSADVVFVFVVNAEQVEQVLFGAEGVVSSARPDTVVVCCATTPPSFAREAGRRLTEAGLLALDAPVSGGAAKAMTAEMSIMVSGSEAAFDKAKPALEAISIKLFQLGDELGVGSQVKMINQLLAGVHIAATAEALTFGIRQGLDPAMLYEVISQCAGSSWMFENRGPHIVDGDYLPRSAVDIFVKDMSIVSSEAAQCEFPVPLSEVSRSLFAQASEFGHGDEDDAAVAKVYAKKGGIQLP